MGFDELEDWSLSVVVMREYKEIFGNLSFYKC